MSLALALIAHRSSLRTRHSLLFPQHSLAVLIKRQEILTWQERDRGAIGRAPSPVINNTLARHPGYVQVHAGYLWHGVCRLSRHRRRAERGATEPLRPAAEEIALLGVTRPPAASAPAATSSRAAQKEDFERVDAGRSRRTTSATSSTSAATTRWTRRTKWPGWPASAGLDLVATGGPRPSTMTWATASSS